jgi:hypothetical protein
MPTLPSVKEVPEYIVLSSSNDEDSQIKGTQSVKHEHIFQRSRVKLEPLDESGDGDGSDSEDVMITTTTGNPSDDFIVSETPSKTLGSDSVGLSYSTIKIAVSQSEHTPCGRNIGSRVTTGDVTPTSYLNIYKLVVAIGNQPNTRCILKIVDLSLYPHDTVKYLPCQYNGDAIFELLAILAPKDGAAGRLDGMDRKHDGHAWTET